MRHGRIITAGAVAWQDNRHECLEAFTISSVKCAFCVHVGPISPTPPQPPALRRRNLGSDILRKG